MEYKARHRRLWGLICFTGKVLAKHKLRFSGERNDIPGPCLVLSNHTTDWDPIMVGSTFKHQMYFVASEFVMRMGLGSKLLKFFFDPIMRQKGGNAAGTVKSILRCLKDGYSVCLFPEGNRSWDGETGEFPYSTAKLAKTGGATLVTYRISGGYFSSPRWAGKSVRRGRTSGAVTGIYTPEQLKKMSVEEVAKAIHDGIYENAYEAQGDNPVRYRGKNLAEHIETLFFACPNCGKLHAISSRGNTVRCEACGAEAEYLETGYLKGSFKYDNILEWNRWQKTLIDKLCDNPDDAAIFEDDDIELDEVYSAKETRLLSKGRVALYKDRLELPGGLKLYSRDIIGMSVLRDANLFIGTEGKMYQIHSQKVFCCVKYLLACRTLGFVDSFV